MTKAQRKKKAAKIKRIKAKASRAMTKKVFAIFKKQRLAVYKAVKKSKQGRLSTDIENSIKKYNKSMTIVFKSYYLKMFNAGKIFVDNSFKKQTIPNDPFAIMRDDYINRLAGEKVVGISDNSIKKIKKSLEFGLAAGMSPEDLASLLKSSLPRILSTKRARVIARTEMHNTFENASMEVAKSRGLLMNKIWVATGDGDTREGHMEMDGVEIPLDSLFDVNRYDSKGGLIGTDPMTGPGDPDAPAAQVVNCRCTLLYEQALT